MAARGWLFTPLTRYWALDAAAGALLEIRSGACRPLEGRSVIGGVAGGRGSQATGMARLESASRRRRLRSARISEAFWYRKSRFFSKALWMIRSISIGISGCTFDGGTGVWCRIPTKTNAAVFPGNGDRPVAISYNTTPSEN